VCAFVFSCVFPFRLLFSLSHARSVIHTFHSVYGYLNPLLDFVVAGPVLLGLYPVSVSVSVSVSRAKDRNNGEDGSCARPPPELLRFADWRLQGRTSDLYLSVHCAAARRSRVGPQTCFQPSLHHSPVAAMSLRAFGRALPQVPQEPLGDISAHHSHFYAIYLLTAVPPLCRVVVARLDLYILGGWISSLQSSLLYPHQRDEDGFCVAGSGRKSGEVYA
jgi:hypothetical protein